MINRDAAEIIADAILRVAPEHRARLLRELLAHVAAGLISIEGNKSAAEACYRLGDAVVSRASR